MTSATSRGRADPRVRGAAGCRGIYLNTDDVDGLAAPIADLLAGRRPEHKLWGMYEVAVSDPGGTLVRIGWPSELSARK